MLFSLVLFGANLVAWIFLVKRGNSLDRLAVALLIATIAIEPFLDHLQLGTWRIGVALLNLTLFVSLWVLAERSNRWWLVAASAIQLLVLFSHFIPLISPNFYVWTGVVIRLGLWTVLSFIFFAGAWETWAAARFDREERVDEKIGIRHRG